MIEASCLTFATSQFKARTAVVVLSTSILIARKSISLSQSSIPNQTRYFWHAESEQNIVGVFHISGFKDGPLRYVRRNHHTFLALLHLIEQTIHLCQQEVIWHMETIFQCTQYIRPSYGIGHISNIKCQKNDYQSTSMTSSTVIFLLHNRTALGINPRTTLGINPRTTFSAM